MGDMYKLQKEAKRIKKELGNTHISAEKNGIKITANANQELVKVEILDESILQDRHRLEAAFLDATTRAMKKGQAVAAEKMKGIMGDMGGMGSMLGRGK